MTDKYKVQKVVSTRQIYRQISIDAKNNLREIQVNSSVVPSNSKCDTNVYNDNINSAQHNLESGNYHCDTSVINSDVVKTDDLSHLVENSETVLETKLPSSQNLSSRLQHWTIKHNIPQNAVDDLLKIIVPLHPELPLNSRTLLKTPLSMQTKELQNGGELCYMGFLPQLKRAISFCKIEDFINNEILVSFNIDGLPLFKSSSIQLWPILGLIKNGTSNKPFPVAIFCGTSKPSPLSAYLEDFVNELLQVTKEGFWYKNKIFTVRIYSFVCDAPARAYIKCTKSHGGYSSCDKCMETGEYIQGRVVLANIAAPKRSDDQFQSQLDEDHHVGVSPLVKLPIGLVTHFPIDYMHAVCLGVMKKLLNTWISGNLRVRLSGQSVNILSEKLVNLSKYIPCEFNRRPRSLTHLARWKATEYRQFLLYLGPLVLKGVLDKALYENFLLFHCAIILLCSKKHIDRIGVELPAELLIMFIKHSEKVYGRQFLIYNVHILSHLSDDVLKYGPLDNFSAFPFENYLKSLKDLVRSPHKPLQQIYRRLREIEMCSQNTSSNVISVSLEYYNGQVPPDTYTYKMFKKINYNTFIITIFSHRNADCYCYIKGCKIIQVHNILKTGNNNSVLLYGKEFISCSTYYTYPFNSSDVDIFIVENLSNHLMLFSIDDVLAKCILLPYKNDLWISVPLLHTL